MAVVYAGNSVSVINCEFIGCEASGNGGAVYGAGTSANNTKILFCMGTSATDTFADSGAANTFWYNCVSDISGTPALKTDLP